jgi:hypothetical protein
MKCSFKVISFGVNQENKFLDLMSQEGVIHSIPIGVSAFSAIIKERPENSVNFNESKITIPISMKMAKNLLRIKRPQILKITVETIT